MTHSNTPAGAPPIRSRATRRALDWFVFFVADIQTGFGPFVAVYLTSEKWTQTDIGLVLTVAGLITLMLQVPCGALVDSVRSLRAAAAVAVSAIGAAAFALAVWPVFPVVLASRIMHAAGSCVLGPAIASMSLNFAGSAGISTRLGRNASFASIGTGLAAAGMAACGYYLSSQAVFLVAAALVGPALIALGRIRAAEVTPQHSGAAAAHRGPSWRETRQGLATLLRDRALMVFAFCIVLFQLANAAMLPLAASMVTLRSASAATVMVGAAVVVPQLIVAVLSPIVGTKAQSWGRRPLLIIGFAALPVRALLFAVIVNPNLLVVAQMLDGISACVLGVLVPLTMADVTRRTGHFNLAQGAIGCAVGIGASISTTLAGKLSDLYGSYAAFVAMGVVAAAAVIVVALFMPETRTAPGDAPREQTPA
ncbi:MFS transporter [Lichenihabitans sp. Uapishka_5]|uniref:MFS transporter n=1 Tax=Lichenihabitans sp. Uapishka_5 TaxID=3037302 RepID=UPI0029E81783|nr:MFS transporter [Lichenihabitans sp. Uapishka_5]MDX7949910.1 MFS transporter [Lichenihabitans sp. Uapishka_5]